MYKQIHTVKPTKTVLASEEPPVSYLANVQKNHGNYSF